MQALRFIPGSIPGAIPVAIAIALLLSCCAPGPVGEGSSRSDRAPEQRARGWYVRHQGQDYFIACGAASPRRLAPSALLSERTRGFVIEDDTPLYMELRLSPPGGSGDTPWRVRAVERAGAEAPVRDCPLQGLAFPAP